MTQHTPFEKIKSLNLSSQASLDAETSPFVFIDRKTSMTPILYNKKQNVMDSLTFHIRSLYKILSTKLFFNKYWRLFIFVLTCILSSVVYIGWSPFTTMLIRSGVYSSQCPPDEVILDPNKGCLAQQKIFNHIYYTGLASEAIIGAVAGVCFDYAGPFLTGCLGEVMFSLGWLCFAFSDAQTTLLYPGIVLLAGAGNMVSFPTLILADLFPKISIWITSVIIAAQSTSSIIPTVLLWIMNRSGSSRHKNVFLYYFFYAVLPCGIIFLLSLPLKRKKEKFHATADVETVKKDPSKDSTLDQSQLPEFQEPYLNPGISAKQLENPTLHIQVFSTEYLVFSLFYMLQQLQYAYFPNFLRDDIGSSYSFFLAAVLPAQGLIGPLIGALTEKTTVLPIAFMLASVTTVMYCIALFFGERSAYILIAMYVVTNSYIFTTRFNYVGETFSPSNYGALVGIMGCASGVVTLAVGFLPKFSYTLGCVVYVLSGVVALLCIIFLIQRKKYQQYEKHKSLTTNKKIKNTDSGLTSHKISL